MSDPTSPEPTPASRRTPVKVERAPRQFKFTKQGVRTTILLVAIIGIASLMFIPVFAGKVSLSHNPAVTPAPTASTPATSSPSP